MKWTKKIAMYVAILSMYSNASVPCKKLFQDLRDKICAGSWMSDDVNAYLDMGGDPNIAGYTHGDTSVPLVEFAFFKINVQSTPFLLKRLIMNEKTNLSPVLLFYAVAKNQPELFILLLKRGIKPSESTISDLINWHTNTKTLIYGRSNQKVWEYIIDNWQNNEWQEKEIKDIEKELKRIVFIEEESHNLMQGLSREMLIVSIKKAEKEVKIALFENLPIEVQNKLRAQASTIFLS